MKDTIKDYGIYFLLLVLLITMVGSALMLIKTMSIKWFFATVITTLAGLAGSLLDFGDSDNHNDDEEP